MDHVVLGVSGGIAAYKSVEVLRRLREAGLRVTVVPTRAALRFVGEPTWAALSGEPVRAEVWDDAQDVPHVRLGQTADLILVAPATADLMARAVHGIADDLLTNILLTAHCPIVMAPAMHTEMWLHPATRRNVAVLRERGVIVLDPDTGRLTGSDSGPGRLPEPKALVDQVLSDLTTQQDLAGLRILITAGGTREPIDPVRFLGNHSSGRQGIALAASAARRGAEVTLITAHTSVLPPPGMPVVTVSTAEEMQQAVMTAAATADVIVMAAAVADYRARDVSLAKLKKQPEDQNMSLALTRNPDILRSLVEHRTAGQTIVGFAAETGDLEHDPLALAKTKFAQKGCDLLVVNVVGDGRAFGTTENAVTILGPGEAMVSVGPADKTHIADAIWDEVLRHR